MLMPSMTLSEKINNRYACADMNDITVLPAVCPECRAMSAMSDSGACYIGIDYSVLNSETEELVALTHEIGHCSTGAFYNMYSPFSLVSQQEYRADVWAVKRLIPRAELMNALNHGMTEVWELAEFFTVPEKMIKLAFWVYFDKKIE